MDDTLISICTPAYKAERYLAETLASVRAQTYTHWEYVLVEDGSADRTQALLDEFARQGTQSVRYYRHPRNRGLSSTRNSAISHARGTWVALLDSDDLWTPDHLEKLVACARAHPGATIVHSGSVLFDSDTGRELEIRAPSPAQVAGFPLSLFLGNYIIQPSSVLIQKTLWSRMQGFDQSFRYVDDREMWMRCTRSGATITFTGGNSCLYRKHATALSTHGLPMAVEAARVLDKASGWTTIPAALRRRRAADAWHSAGRIALRAKPRAASDFFRRALRHRPLAAVSLAYWLVAGLLTLARGRRAPGASLGKGS